MKDEVKVAAEEVAKTEGTVHQLDYDEIIRKCLREGAKRVNNLTVKAVNVTEKDNHTMVSLSIVPPIDGYVQNQESGEFELSKTNVVFTSTFALSGVFKYDEDLVTFANKIVDTPSAINLLLAGGTIDILQIPVAEGEEYTNSFSTDAQPYLFEHDAIVNHVIKVRPGKTGKKLIELALIEQAKTLIL